MDKVRVRFAPSPTGPLHIGGVRTALFNYLFAKKNNGDFLLRIEDTDQTRFVPGAEEYIIESLKWCGIKVDEGVEEGGNYGPYKQSERKNLYKNFSDNLVESGNAYYAFDTAEELDALRKSAEEKKETFIYNAESRKTLKNSLTLSKEEVEQKIKNGESYVIRFKIPENEEIQLTDIIRGEMKVHSNTLDDKVLFKSDGMPTYHLANIVDDHLMKISHVIRGEEWLPSLPLHVLLYKSFGWDTPQFAHLPLILKPVGNGKLSKRDGDKMGFPVFPIEWKTESGETYSGYREDGYFKDAFINMLALLGWNPGTDQEIFSMDELINLFSLERVGKSGSKFDPEKTKWFNHQYLNNKTNTEIGILFMKELQQKGFNKNIDIIEKIVGLVKERVNFIHELWEQSYFFFEAPTSYDEKVVKKKWKENTPEILKKIVEILNNQANFTRDKCHDAVVKYIEENEIGMGAAMNALRLSLVGKAAGPDLFTIIEMIGKEDTVARIEKAINTIKK
jgi:glutamyl-tRNA synthetase